MNRLSPQQTRAKDRTPGMILEVVWPSQNVLTKKGREGELFQECEARWGGAMITQEEAVNIADRAQPGQKSRQKRR